MTRTDNSTCIWKYCRKKVKVDNSFGKATGGFFTMRGICKFHLRVDAISRKLFEKENGDFTGNKLYHENPTRHLELTNEAKRLVKLERKTKFEGDLKN